MYFLKAATIALALCLSVPSFAATATLNDNDPRFLSKITLPTHTDCVMDPSNDGRLLYTVCWAGTGSNNAIPTEFNIYDISDLRNPQQLSKTNIGYIRGQRLLARNKTAFLLELGSTGVQLIDINDLQHPQLAETIVGSFYNGFKVSDDGLALILRNNRGENTFNYTYFDTSNPNHPKEIRTGEPDALAKLPTKWLVYDSLKLEGLSKEIEVMDIRGGVVLGEDPSSSYLDSLYDISAAHTAKLLSTFPGPGNTYHTSIIPGAQAVAFLRGDRGAVYIELRSTTKSGFDSKKLQRDFLSLASKYAECLKPENISPKCSSIRWDGLAQIADDGIDKLLNEQPKEISHGERVLMLNDYGFWLYRWHEHDRENLLKSVAFLKKAAELSPDRAVAWLNIGDTLYALVNLAETEGEKAELWRDARHAFSRYHALSGKEASAFAAINAVELDKAVFQANDICTYIADAYNHGYAQYITKPSGSAEIKGQHFEFKEKGSGGSCSEPDLYIDPDDASGLLPHIQLGGVSGEGGNAPDEISIIPFKGKDYVLASSEGVPFEAADIAKGNVCSFSHKFETKLTENKNPALCEKYLKGEGISVVNWDREIDLKDPEERSNTYYRAAEVSLEPSKKILVGHFDYQWSGGCGCSYGGIRVIDGDHISTSPLNKSLQEQEKSTHMGTRWNHCRAADTRLIQFGNKMYVDMVGGESRVRSDTPRLLSGVVNGEVQPLCRIDQVLRLVPVPTASSAPPLPQPNDQKTEPSQQPPTENIHTGSGRFLIAPLGLNFGHAWNPSYK